jgi:hypothetical protein
MTTNTTAIDHEIQDLDGLVADLYRRIARDEPGRAAQVARFLATSAGYFDLLAAADATGQ